MSIEDIKTLVKQERGAERELLKAKEEATRIIEEAKAKAEKITAEAEDKRQYDNLLQTHLKKIDENKRKAEEDLRERIDQLERASEKNMTKSVDFIVKNVLGE